MAEQENRTITVVIAGRPYPLRVKESDEAGLRQMVAEINAKFNEFQVNYTNRDKQDCLVMTLLTYASELRALQQAADVEVGGDFNNRFAELEKLLDSLL